jgi:hypothetical protein
VPTARPRYTLTDTGQLARMLDEAQTRWPDVARKDLLLRLAQEGHRHLQEARDAADDAARRSRQLAAAARTRELIDADALLSDAAWR